MGCRQQRICGWGWKLKNCDWVRWVAGMLKAADLRLGRKRRAGGCNAHIVRLPQDQRLTNFDPPGVDFLNCLIFNETNNVCVAPPALLAPASMGNPPQQLLPPQPQAIEDDGDGAEGHGGAGPHGIQEQAGDGVEDAGSNGNPQGVINECPE